jgi:adenylate cyclase
MPQLKNIVRPMRVHRVLLGGTAAKERTALALPDKPSIADLQPDSVTQSEKI